MIDINIAPVDIAVQILVWLAYCVSLVLASVYSPVVLKVFAGGWWVTMLAQNSFRKKRSNRALVVAVICGTIPVLFFGTVAASAGLLLFAVFAPAYTNWKVRRGAWLDDDDDIKTGARAIRNRIRERREEEPLSPNEGPWPEYVNDVVRAKRERGYRPPDSQFPHEGDQG